MNFIPYNLYSIFKSQYDVLSLNPTEMLIVVISVLHPLMHKFLIPQRDPCLIHDISAGTRSGLILEQNKEKKETEA